LQEKTLGRCEFRQIEVSEFAAFSLKNQEIPHFSQPTQYRPVSVPRRRRHGVPS
jgi:hypothetical protein